MLHDAGHRHDRLGRVDAFLHEERGDEVVDADAVLRDQAAQRGGAAQPAQAALGERHGRCYSRVTGPRATAQRGERGDEAVDRVRIGLGVDAQPALAGGLPT